MEHETPEHIVRSILDGEIEKFELLVRRFQTPIFRYCYHMLGHREEAEDTSQEVFWKAYCHLTKYKQEVPFAAWLYKIAYHSCLDVLRKRKRSKLLPFLFQNEKQASNVEQHIEDVYFSESVYLALSRLSLEERTLLILRGVEEKTFEEISLIVNKKSVSLRKKYERTVAKFRLNYAKVEGREEKDAKEKCRPKFERTI